MAKKKTQDEVFTLHDQAVNVIITNKIDLIRSYMM